MFHLYVCIQLPSCNSTLEPTKHMQYVILGISLLFIVIPTPFLNSKFISNSILHDMI